MEKFKLAEVEYEVTQAKLRTWLELELLRDKIIKAVEDTDELAKLICLYISTALNNFNLDFSYFAWIEIAYAFVCCEHVNALQLNDLQFIKYLGKKENDVWDYEKRGFWEFSHLLCKEYGWTLEYVADLNVESAFRLLQEILIANQFEKEWEWGLSENAFSYDKATKTSKFVPLKRPSWMEAVPEVPKKVKIPVYLLPVGNVVSYRGKNVVN